MKPPCHQACFLLAIVGAVIGLLCGLFFPVWVLATIEVICILIALFGVYKTWIVYENRHEFISWAWLSGSLIASLPVGYLVGLARIALI